MNVKSVETRAWGEWFASQTRRQASPFGSDSLAAAWPLTQSTLIILMDRMPFECTGI